MRIPADVERPDRLLGGLTARQLAILSAEAILLWATYSATRHLVPLAAFGAAAAPLAGACVFVALGRVEGVPADRWLAAAIRHRLLARRLVVAPDGIPTPPALLAEAAGPLPAPLRLPLGAISSQGVLDLGPDGAALVCRANAVTFDLRSAAEQEALVAGFARYLSSLAEAVQVLVRSAPEDVGPAVERLTEAAPGLPHVALEKAARDHAAFLEHLGATRELLRREVYLVLRQRGGEDAQGSLLRRGAEATAALVPAGVTLEVLEATEVAALLRRCLDPAAQLSVTGPTDEPVTYAQRTTPSDTGPSPLGGGAR